MGNLVVSDELVIGFFTTVVTGLAAAVVFLYRNRNKH